MSRSPHRLQRPRRGHRPTTLAFALVVAAACGKERTFVDGGPVDANHIDGDGVPVGELPAELDLGPGDCGAATTTTFMVTNRGGGELTYRITSSDPIVAVVPDQGAIIAGTSTTFTVTAQIPAAATAGQALAATLTVETNLPGHATATVPVRVTPRGATIAVEPPSVGFGQFETGLGATRGFTVRNTGTAAAIVTVAAPAAPFGRSFGAAGVATVAAGADVTGEVTFQPTLVGAATATAAITIAGAVCGPRPAALALTGEGARPGGVLVQGVPVDFGPIDCGTASASRTFTLVNTAQQPSPFTITALADGEGDDARYQIAPASGTIAAQGTQVVTVTRLAVPVPATPRAYDARLRVHTTLPVATDTDVDVRQTLRGPVLSASVASLDFGYVPAEGSETAPFTLTNTGTTAATLTATTPANFDATIPAMLAAGAAGAAASITYSAPVAAPVTGSATIDAPGACSAPVTLQLAAGDGPLAALGDVEVTQSCPPANPMAAELSVGNDGTQPLTIACAELGTSSLAPVVSPPSLTVMPGEIGTFALEISPGSPVHAGSAAATLRCQLNEPLHPARTLTVTRTIDGADIVLAAPAPLEFLCNQPASRPYTTTNVGTQPGFLFPESNLFLPLEDRFTIGAIDPGQTVMHTVDAYLVQSLIGLPDPCAGGGSPGDIAFEGAVGAGGGSGTICSVSPATLPVILRYAATPE